ncbi:DUF3429 domain-containing protein [Algihabitans albus]|uniref:DUF3429 domain-containing protein n=1 Tax=Algihabitans albus TaxID=2164067 RepID=UPI001ABCD75D|nr:DUF3429 domain-containing protein [Algihabitans albus]
MRQVPRPALWLGLAGLIPFAAGAVAVWALPQGWNDFAQFIQMAYAACILSFMGAVHWGLAMAGTGVAGPGVTGAGTAAGDSHAGMTWTRTAGSVIPPLLGWLALIMAPLPGLILLILSFVGLFWADMQAIRLGRAPTWYLPLRKTLTIGVVICLGISVMRLVV